MNDSFRRDFETPEQYRRRLARQDAIADDEPLTVETDIGKVLDDDDGPLGLLIDLGPRYNSRRTEAAIQRQEDRITRLDDWDRW